MAKRRLTQRQRARIQAIQQRRLQTAEARQKRKADELINALDNDSDARHGLVIANHGPSQLVENEQGEVHRCVPRQNLGATLVSGDRVLWLPAGDGEGVITALQARKTTLSRLHAGGENRPLAANVDRMLVVAAPAPALDEALIDRYLVAAERLRIEPVLIVNKADLLDTSTRPSLEKRTQVYERLGYPVLYLSTKSGENIQAFHQLLPGHTTILNGQSGVGKSSLVHTLLPDRDIRIRAISTITGLGAHTTSTTTLYHVPTGGDLIDSPGVRNFELGELEPIDVEYGYREFHDLPGVCKFKNCRHQNEPGCAWRALLNRRQINPGRYERMVKMRAEVEQNRRLDFLKTH